ncbi:MAG TPA: TetR/AcrR family transcriptional regulator [Syntrophales bacterium]|nr:TetR/AcrR family transcriptional regulator [Syntrophales bacterium]
MTELLSEHSFKIQGRHIVMKNTDKRKEILESALNLISEHGFHRSPMAMIADRAKVGTGTVYCYFESKDVLIRELFLDLRETIMAVLLEGYSVDNPIRERFMHICSRLLKYFIKHPVHFRFIEQYMNSPYGVDYRRERALGEASGMKAMDDLFANAVTQQIIKDFPTPVHFALAFGPLIALARDHILGFIEVDDAMIDRIIEACWDGIKR